MTPIRAAMLMLLWVAAPVAAAPARIVSVNPCIDAILIEVADPGQIAGISHYSQDPRSTSIPISSAMRFSATSGTAEEVMALAPDLVLAGGHVSPATANALARLGIPLIELPVPETIVQAQAQITRIAAIIGHPGRGQALNARIDAAVRAAGAWSRPVSGLIWAGGLVPGSGTLTDALLTRAGFRNASASFGLKRWDILPLEYLVASPPAVLLTSGDNAHLLSHPALRALQRHTVIADFPVRLLQCGGPTIIPALARLAAVRRSL